MHPIRACIIYPSIEGLQSLINVFIMNMSIVFISVLMTMELMFMSETKTKGKTLDDFIRKIYNKKFQSVWTCTLGANQSGKTDWNLLQMERLHKLGLADGFGANIPDLESDFKIDFIEDFETLKNHCQMLNPNPDKYGIKRYFFLGDEMGNWAPKDMPWLNVDFIRELQQVRKYGLSFLGTAIDRVDSRILNEKHFHGYFEKVSKSNPKVAVYYDWFRRRRPKLTNIPRTKIKFNTWHSATFYMKPQVKDVKTTVLNPEHEMIIKYLEKGKSWDKTEYKRWQGKNAVDKVLDYHMSHCLHAIQEPVKDNVPSVTADTD